MSSVTSQDNVTSMDDVQKAYDDLADAQAKQKADTEMYKQRIAESSSESGFELAITLLYVLMANYPDQQDSHTGQVESDATISGHYEDQIAVSGDGLVLMGQLTSFTNGLQNQFNDKNGTTADMKSFATSADQFLDATDPKTGWLKDSTPGGPISTAREQIMNMRKDIYITGDNKYNPDKGATYHLSDDLSDKKHSHSFGELYTNAQKAGQSSGSSPQTDDSLGARDCIQSFTQAFQLTSTVFDGANSSYKLETDQETNDYKNFQSFMSSFGQDFFKPSDTAVNNMSH